MEEKQGERESLGAAPIMSSSLELEGASPLTFNPDGNRWVVLCVFSLFSFSNALQWICFAPVVEEAKSFFDMNSLQVNWMSMIYALLYAICGFLCCGTLDKLGLKLSLVLGSSLNFAGSLLRFLAPFVSPTFGMLFTAQIFCSFAQLFVLSIPPLVAAQWFPSKERTLSTAIGAAANTVGNASAMLLPPLIVRGAESIRAGFITLFGIQLGLCGILWICCLLLPRKPHSPPSFAAMASPMNKVDKKGPKASLLNTFEKANLNQEEGQEEDGEPSLFKEFIKMFSRNVSFRFLCAAASISLGAGWAFSTVLAQLMIPFGISEDAAGWSGFAALLGGALVALVVGPYVDRKRVYKFPMIALLSGCTVAFCLMLLALWTASGKAAVYLGTILYAIGGTLQNATLPIFFEYGLESTFPTPESLSATSLSVIGSALCVIFIFAASAVLGNNPSSTEATVTAIVLIALLGIGVIVLAVMKPESKRHEFETRMEIASASGSPTLGGSTDRSTDRSFDAVGMTPPRREVRETTA